MGTMILRSTSYVLPVASNPLIICVPPFAGTDEKAIISVLAHRSNTQRMEIITKFKSMYGKVS